MSDEGRTDALIEGLRRSNPVRAVDVAGAADQRPAQLLVEAIISGEVLARRRRWPRRLRRARNPRATGTGEAVELLRRIESVTPDTAALAATGLENSPLAEGVLARPLPGLRRAVARWRKVASSVVRPNTDDVDLVALLQAANPYRTEPAPGTAWNLRSQQVLEQIVAGTPARRRGLRTRRLLVPVLVGGAILGSAAAGYVLAQRHVSQLNGVACYETASLTSSFVADYAAGPAVGACERLWFDGTFGPPRKPALVACVLASGNYGVFPGSNDEVCARLGLSAALSARERTVAIGRFILYASHALSARSCVGPVDARAIARTELDKLGLAAWSVQVLSGFSAARPCTVPVFHLPRTRVTLVPFPRTAAPRPTSTSS